MRLHHNKRKAEPIPLQFLKGWAFPQEKVGVVKLLLYSFFVMILLASCNKKNTPNIPAPPNTPVTPIDTTTNEVKETLHNIDLNNWKVTLPVGNPSEVVPPEILDYATNPDLKKWMYDDSTDSSLVFYTEPGSTTPNSKYSRTVKGTLKVANVSGTDGDLDRLIVMQIHGRLTNAQRDLIGEDDNNAPPVLKIYWDNGKINVRRKVLKNLEVSDTEILKTSAWTDESHWFEKDVGNEKFAIEIIAKENVLKIILNDGEEAFEFDDVHVKKWAVFENYFKAGNYLISTEEGAYSLVKYYELEVQH